MATNVLLPQWGMNMEDGLMVKWLVAEGDAVEAGQPLVEVETAKINSELEAPVSGVIAHILVPEGSTANVTDIVAVIAEPGEIVPRPASRQPVRVSSTPRHRPSVSSPIADSGRTVTSQITPIARRLAQQNGIDLSNITGTGPNGRIVEDDIKRAVDARQLSRARLTVQIVPRAMRLAAEHGINLDNVTGTGPGGRIIEADVEKVVQGDRVAVPEGKGEPLSGLRKIIADRMMESVDSKAPVTLTTEADVTELVKLREDLVSAWRPHRIRPLDQDLIVHAVSAALPDHERVNATITGDNLELLEGVNVGVAMAVPDGLMVPVIRDADKKDLLANAQELHQLAEKSRDGSLKVDDMMGAGFTITSLASFDIDAFTPIIDPPQVAILGVGRIVEKPAVHQGEIVARSMMFLSLTFDHRALDGATAGAFLKDVKGRLEDPSWMTSAGEVQGS